ncbi:unnamed protein product [Rotaria sordida]|uniref:O(6)-methylguanine-induced apoptosis 2 n=1 Tax=Rotaria sordida TaxID=392033 RepID=A0A814DRX6_9BILA|nr:unnamed protein product [Rotaria sordida]CAF0984356.1 unnamed protein product [Rotaria sordida]CAF1045580.1 unnamed protein product [Rotaria sordida]CAF1201306.1 unnamed protein product [Rotaria sordida]
MTITQSDSITKGEISRKFNRVKSEESKIHRGFTVCATGSPSIPSRYLTIITSNTEQRGFQQTAKRFQYDINFAPGPGQYQTIQPLDKQLEKTSDSKRGSGGFASRSRREGSMSGASSAPAPTTYNVSSNLANDHHDFNRMKYSSMFQKPIAERPLSSKSSLPAPNQYDIREGLKQITKSNNVSAQAAFRSHTKRSVPTNKYFITPAPGTYNLDDSTKRLVGSAHQSSFKSTSKRDTFGCQPGIQLPGPADYRPFEKPTEEPHRQLLPRRHYLTISAPAVPIPPEAPYPGPGYYELRDFKDVEKKYMSSAAFVSNTSRWAINTMTAAEQPGPCSYTPNVPAKQSFNFNFERKWI